MYEAKTKQTDSSVEAFLSKVDEQKRKDCAQLIDLLKKITKHEPKMWGTSILGFDSYHYKYASGHEGDSALVGLSPRKKNITLYLMCGLHKDPELMKKLGKHKTGVGCLYIDKVADIDLKILEEVVKISIAALKKQVEKMSKNKK
jgi:hypothetical protein